MGRHEPGSAVTSLGNPLARGFYTVKDAARLIEVGDARRIRGWLGGHARRDVGPLLTRDHAPIGDAQEMSFLDLMEVRFVEHFRAAGVKVGTLRDALRKAREVFGEDKPFARGDIVFVPSDDRRAVVVEEVLRPAAEANKDPVLWNMVTGQMLFREIAEGRLARGLSFDPKTLLTSTWVPRLDLFPTIRIDPRIASGQPIVPSDVPTRTLYDAWVAEGRAVPVVADWFDVPPAEVLAAVGFEKRLSEEGPQRRLAA